MGDRAGSPDRAGTGPSEEGKGGWWARGLLGAAEAADEVDRAFAAVLRGASSQEAAAQPRGEAGQGLVLLLGGDLYEVDLDAEVAEVREELQGGAGGAPAGKEGLHLVGLGVLSQARLRPGLAGDLEGEGLARGVAGSREGRVVVVREERGRREGAAYRRIAE